MADSKTKEHFKARGKELAEGFTEGTKAIGRGAKGRFIRSEAGQRGRTAIAKARGKAYTAQGRITETKNRARGLLSRFSGLGLSIKEKALLAGADFANRTREALPNFGPRRGFEVRSAQWVAALMLPFLVVIMMAVTTVIYQATISVLVSLGLTNVAFLWFIQTIMGLGLLILGIFGLVKWVESQGFGIFRWQ